MGVIASSPQSTVRSCLCSCVFFVISRLISQWWAGKLHVGWRPEYKKSKSLNITNGIYKSLRQNYVIRLHNFIWVSCLKCLVQSNYRASCRTIDYPAKFDLKLIGTCNLEPDQCKIKVMLNADKGSKTWSSLEQRHRLYVDKVNQQS